jgi:carboxyl-terminal processing protease
VAAQNLDLLDARQRPEWDRWHLADGSGLAQFGSVRPGNPSFRGRSALLVDDHTRSAGEVMAQSYKRDGFGAVLGSTTAGAGAAGALFVMPGDLLLYVAVARRVTDRIEGVGVSPDHPVARPLPYAGNADPVLDAAVELLLGQAAR